MDKLPTGNFSPAEKRFLESRMKNPQPTPQQQALEDKITSIENDQTLAPAEKRYLINQLTIKQ